MSIAPPSDIVLDVAQAADPVRRQAAAAKLASLAGTTDIDFSAVLEARTTPLSTPAPAATAVRAPEIGHGHQLATPSRSPYQKFEAVVLQNFMQSILPKDSELFGDSFSADAYRSMLAEQLAQQVAKTGKLGIAHAIEMKEASRQHAAAPAATPAPSEPSA